MHRGWRLAAAGLAGLAIYGLLLLEDTVLGVLPRVNPDVLIWAGAILAAAIGALLMARDEEHPALVSLGGLVGVGGFAAAFVGMLAALSLGTGACVHPQAAWHQPGLYEAVDAEGSPEAWTVRTERPVGLAFENATLDERVGPEGYALTGVHRQLGDHGRHLPFDVRLSAPSAVTLRAPETVDESQVRSAFQAFASNVTDADGDTIETWTDRLVASGEASTTSREPRTGETMTLIVYQVNLTEPLTVEELFHERAHLPEIVEDPARGLDERFEVGRASVEAGDWTFRLQFASVIAEHEDDDPPIVETIQVDALDRAGAEVALEDTTDHRNRTLRLVTEAFAELGWPQPMLEREDVDIGAIC